MTLKWREESRIKTGEVEPQAALTELERIRLAHEGKLKPEDIVVESEPKQAVLHPMFEWRNAAAAHQYRLWQARQIVKSVRFVTVEDGHKVEQPAFVSVIMTDEQGKRENYYQSAEIAVTRPDEWLSAIAVAQARISIARRSLEELERIARGSDDADRLARLAIAAKALDTASEALKN